MLDILITILLLLEGLHEVVKHALEFTIVERSPPGATCVSSSLLGVKTEDGHQIRKILLQDVVHWCIPVGKTGQHREVDARPCAQPRSAFGLGCAGKWWGICEIKAIGRLCDDRGRDYCRFVRQAKQLQQTRLAALRVAHGADWLKLGFSAPYKCLCKLRGVNRVRWV
jgi:hypothetical protein